MNIELTAIVAVGHAVDTGLIARAVCREVVGHRHVEGPACQSVGRHGPSAHRFQGPEANSGLLRTNGATPLAWAEHGGLVD